MSRVHKFYYEFITLREWYLDQWPEECIECGHMERRTPKCSNCGVIKPIYTETVTDPLVVKELEKFNKKITERIERNLDERDPE